MIRFIRKIGKASKAKTIVNILVLTPALFIFMVQSLYATVSASVDRTQIADGESLTLTIKLDDMNEQPDLAPLKKDFDVYGTSTSSQTSVINGKSTSNISYIVTLLPKRVGNITIPALTVGSEQTKTLTITVTKAAQGTQGKQTANVFLDASLSSDSAYVNTPVLYTLKLYYAEPLSNLSMQPLQLANASIEPFGKNSQYQAQQNGKTYHVVEQQFLITANQAGEISIPQSIIQAAVLQNNPNSFFAMQSAKPILVKSNPLTLHVKPIPQNIDINDWLPANSVTLKDSWSSDSNELTVGEPVTRTIVLTATGVQAASLPNLTFPHADSINAYPDKAQSKDYVENNLPAASKVFKVAYIPTQKGIVEFPQIKVHWFDVKSQTEQTAILPAQTFKVLPGKVVTPVQTSAVNATPVVQPAKTVIKVVHSKLWMVLAIIFAILWLVTLILLLIVVRKFKSQKVSPTSHKQTSPAKPDINQALKDIKQACDNKGLVTVNNAIVSWGNALFNQNFYSAMDVASVIDDKEFKEMLILVNKALYANGKFDEYDALYQHIKSYKRKGDKDQEVLTPLYPK
ncbi:BatD family protein [Cysteiniphilum sp. 6C5]|uniref:BatD family protein n=1 Tax=unclassified Cysteiniphilum TaxID=2610889 RepID=UPI003F878403